MQSVRTGIAYVPYASRFAGRIDPLTNCCTALRSSDELQSARNNAVGIELQEEAHRTKDLLMPNVRYLDERKANPPAGKNEHSSGETSAERERGRSAVAPWRIPWQ